MIGQSAYRSVPALPNPANDAKAVTQLLSEFRFRGVDCGRSVADRLRAQIGDFAAKVAAKGPDTVALVFYAGHGLQIDGENFLVPVDIDPKREADIPLQAVRLNDILNTLTSVPSKMRILMLDACRNNPFPAISKTTGGGLAIVDTKIGAPGTFLSFSTSPGAVAEDGTGANSPYTSALLLAAKEPGLSIEDTLKRVRVSVNKATEGRQTPWDSSSLTDDFRFVRARHGRSGRSSKARGGQEVRVEEWKRDLQGKPVEAANELIVADGSDEAYEAFAGLYAQTPRGLQARDWLDRHRRMVAWNNAVIVNTAAGYRAFLAQYPDSDLTATARKLEERLRNRPNAVAVVAAPRQRPRHQRFAGRADLSLQCAAVAAEEGRYAAEEARRIRRSASTASRRAACANPTTTSWSSAARRRATITSRRPDLRIGIGIGGGGYGGGRYGSGYTGRSRGGY